MSASNAKLPEYAEEGNPLPQEGSQPTENHRRSFLQKMGMLLGGAVFGIGAGSKEVQGQIDTDSLLDSEAKQAEQRIQALQEKLQEEAKTQEEREQAARERIAEHWHTREQQHKDSEVNDVKLATWEAAKPMLMPAITNLAKAAWLYADAYRRAKGGAKKRLEERALDPATTKDNFQMPATITIDEHGEIHEPVGSEIEAELERIRNFHSLITKGEVPLSAVLTFLTTLISLRSITVSDMAAKDKWTGGIASIVGGLASGGLIHSRLKHQKKRAGTEIAYSQDEHYLRTPGISTPSVPSVRVKLPFVPAVNTPRVNSKVISPPLQVALPLKYRHCRGALNMFAEQLRKEAAQISKSVKDAPESTSS